MSVYGGKTRHGFNKKEWYSGLVIGPAPHLFQELILKPAELRDEIVQGLTGDVGWIRVGCCLDTYMNLSGSAGQCAEA